MLRHFLQPIALIMIQAPPPDDKETSEYIAVSHPITQDVWHDNFVPKYSAIASAEPTWLFLIGIWMLFGGPMLPDAISELYLD